MSIVVLVPTYNKTKDQILNLYKTLNIKSDAIFANQCGVCSNKIYELDNKKIRIISTKTKGVSKNRNILADFADGDLNICIDDDCPLVNNYEQIVLDFFNKNNCDCALFNGIYKTRNDSPVHNKSTKIVKKYIDISYGGGPGFVFKKGLHKSFNLKYNEHVGTPNYICAGEDSLFYFDLVKSNAKFYRSKDILFNIAEDVSNSSYYSGINKQYVVTRGYVLNIVHHKLFLLFAIKHALRFAKQSNISFKIIMEWLKEGRKIQNNEN